ncbi:MAG: HDOD domain-containing protein [Planctomycetota bacterium]|jgi:diguanylate cyclase (GGDEF)-like protein
MQEPKTPSANLRNDLRSIFVRAKVPTNPAIALEILRLADDPASSAEQFADVIRADVALSARLLEMANAAIYAQREPVTTIKRAVTLMGLRRIRMVALGFQLVAHLDRLGKARFDLKSFWQHSVLRACLAREIAARIVPSHAEEAFVIGLLQDCGMLLLVQVLGDDYAALCGLQDLSPTAFYCEEAKRFSHDHVEAIRIVAEDWHLPEMIAVPLGHHHEPLGLGPESTEIQRLSAVSYFVGSLPLLCTLTPGSSEPALREFARSQLGLDEQAVQECLEEAGEAYRQVAPLLPEQLPENLDVTELLDQANHYLSRVATEAETRAEQVQAERDCIHQQQVQLKSALGQYRDRAAHDPLTRLLNRGALVEATLACIRECRDRNVALGVYFLDIDNFKSVNDEYGHHCGDEVLRVVAGTISETVVNGGFAGRYGGEEFVVVVPAIERDDARQAAERLVERVRDTKLVMGGAPASVTCSVGAVWGRPGPATSPQDLFDAADGLMYRAKLAGKDRCCFESLAPLDAGAEPVPDDHAAEDLHQMAIDMNRVEPDGFASMRKHERRDLLAPCVVNCFVSGAPAVRSYPGYVRNISTGGAGLLTTRPMIRGEPVEVVIEQEGGSGVSFYLGGLVAFCRHVQGGIYEVGVQLVVQGREPILSREAGSSDDHLDWVLEALRASHGTEAPYRESA